MAVPSHVAVVENGKRMFVSSGTLFNINGGPNKDDLLFSLREAYASRKPVTFQFYVTDKRFRVHLPVIIKGLTHEDGSGESWNFTGSMVRTDGITSYNIAGYYNSKFRTGTYRIVS